jgi:hypothetical protein
MRASAGVLRRFWPYIKGDRRWLMLGGLCTLAVSGCELGTVYVFDVITNRVLTARHLSGHPPDGGWPSPRWPRWRCSSVST